MGALLVVLGLCWEREASAAGSIANGNAVEDWGSSPGATANADEARPPAAHLQLHFDGGFGASSQGANWGATGLLRWHVLELGSGCGFSGLFSVRTGCGALAGLAFKSEHWQFDTLAESGVNYLHAAGGFLSDDPGAGGAIGYVGARLGTRYIFRGRGHWRADLGLWLFFQSDLTGYLARYEYVDHGWLWGQTSQQSGSKLIGDQTELGLRIVGGFDYLAGS